MTTVLTRGIIYTSDEANPTVDTIVIEGTVIPFVGAWDDSPHGEDADVYDLAGRTVVAGFVDAHTHPSMMAQSLWHVPLPWTSDVDEILAFIGEYAARHPVSDAPFLYFEYYPSSAFGDAGPSKELLDSVVSDRPVLCQDFSEHSSWVNSRMLELMGIDKDMPDPVPGLEIFERHADGEPTGHLREMVHQHFIGAMFEKIGWQHPEQLTTELIAPFLDFMRSNGVTSLLEAWVEDEEILASLSTLDARGDLHLNYEGALRFRSSADLPQAIERVQKATALYASEHIRINTLKLFFDGTNESGNSALLQAACGHDEADHGATAMNAAELAECLLLSNDAQIDVHIHLVGDRAFRVACDAVEAAKTRSEGAAWNIQVTFAHCEFVDPADIPRPAHLGIVINWTPHWSGGYFGEAAAQYLGERRWNDMYRFNEVSEAGARVTFASDVVTGYELNRGAPLFGMAIGSVRPRADARLSRELLLKGYTIDAARQLRLDHKVGSLEVGKSANLNVLESDLFSVPADRIANIAVDAVMFEGRIVAGQLPSTSEEQ